MLYRFLEFATAILTLVALLLLCVFLLAMTVFLFRVAMPGLL